MSGKIDTKKLTTIGKIILFLDFSFSILFFILATFPVVLDLDLKISVFGIIGLVISLFILSNFECIEMAYK